MENVDPEMSAASTKLAARARGFLVRKHAHDTRLAMRERANQNREYISAAVADLESAQSRLEKFTHVKILNENRDFSESLVKAFDLVRKFSKAKDGLQKVTKELDFHPGIGKNILLIMARKSSESLAACERAMGHISGYSDELLNTAHSIEAERLANALKRLKEVRSTRREADAKMTHDTRAKIELFVSLYSKSEKMICRIGKLHVENLYDESSDYDPMGFMFLDGIQSQNYFAKVHPEIDEAVAFVRKTTDAANDVESALANENEKRVIWLNNVLMRREEIDRRQWIRHVNMKEASLRSHKLFVALSRRWFEDGRERMTKENRSREIALIKAREAATRSKQEKIDSSRHCPYQGARIGVSVDRMRKLLEGERIRLLHQEKRKFHIDERDFDTGDRLLHNACWAGHLHLARFFVGECGASIRQLSDPIAKMTPLHVASRAGQSDIVKFLLDSGAILGERDAAGDTALHWAARRDHLGVVKVLLQQMPCSSKIGSKRTFGFVSTSAMRRHRQTKTETIKDIQRLYDFLSQQNERGRIADELTHSTAIKTLLARLRAESRETLISARERRKKKMLTVGLKGMPVDDGFEIRV